MPPPIVPTDESADERNAAAKVWMKRGIALLSANNPEVLPEALNCFDQALAIRRELPFETSSWFRWLLTACWMNRGDVLTRLGKPADLAAAVQSFDEAIFHLQKLPLEEDSQYRGRLALAWMNRSLALRAQASPESLEAALRSLENGRQVIEESEKAQLPVSQALLPTLLLNRAALLLEISPPRPLEALATAQEVLARCRADEHLILQSAEIGLKARHAFCLAVAVLLETPPVDTSRADEWIIQATDKVDEVMQLTARWENHPGAADFRAIRHELFCFGCKLLLAYQPHFMAEFLLDVLDPAQGSALLARDAALYRAGLEALDLAAAELRRRGPLDLGLQKMDRLIAVLESLSVAADRIKKRAEQAGTG